MAEKATWNVHSAFFLGCDWKHLQILQPLKTNNMDILPQKNGLKNGVIPLFHPTYNWFFGGAKNLGLPPCVGVSPGYEPTGNSEAMEGELLYIRPFGSNGRKVKKKTAPNRNPWGFLVCIFYLPIYIMDGWFVVVVAHVFSKWAMKKGALLRVGDLPTFTTAID